MEFIIAELMKGILNKDKTAAKSNGKPQQIQYNKYPVFKDLPDSRKNKPKYGFQHTQLKEQVGLGVLS